MYLVVHHKEDHAEDVVHALGVANVLVKDGVRHENVVQPVEVLVVVALEVVRLAVGPRHVLADGALEGGRETRGRGELRAAADPRDTAQSPPSTHDAFPGHVLVNVVAHGVELGLDKDKLLLAIQRICQLQ